MQRIALFIATHVAVMFTLMGVVHLLGVDRILDARGVGLDLDALVVISLVFGMGGSFLSLALSKSPPRARMGGGASPSVARSSI